MVQQPFPAAYSIQFLPIGNYTRKSRTQKSTKNLLHCFIESRTGIVQINQEQVLFKLKFGIAQKLKNN